MAVTLRRGGGTAEVQRLMLRERLAWWMGRGTTWVDDRDGVAGSEW